MEAESRPQGIELAASAGCSLRAAAAGSGNRARDDFSLSSVAGVEPSVLEVGLLPAESALVSPDWVHWADRLEEYLLHEKEVKDQEAQDEDDDEDDAFDLDDDVDGVDIDQLDLELDPAPLEVPEEPDDIFDHVELEEPDPLDP